MSTEKPKTSARVAPQKTASQKIASQKPADAPPTPAPDAKSTGRVKFDERGNAVWEWQIATGAFGLEVSTQRLQKLEHPALSIAEEGAISNTVRPNPLGTKKGYDPYDSGKLGKQAPPQKKDLRRLSEWLKLKKQADGKKDESED